MENLPLTDAEVFYQFLSDQLAIGECEKSPEDLVQDWRARKMEHEESISAIREGLDDMKAGHVLPFEEVNRAIRAKHGWSGGG